MARKYKRLRYEDRQVIEKMSRAGSRVVDIATTLGVHRDNDSDFYAAAAVHKRKGRYTMPLYKQAGNSIPVTIFESMFRKILLGETENRRQ